MKRSGQARFWLYLPERLVGHGLEGMLHTPRHDPGCEIPADNSGTVTVEAFIDPVGKHHSVRAWARGDRIDQSVLQGYADLVCGSWHSDPPQYPDGTQCDLRADETIGLHVAFPIAGARAAP